MEKEMDQCLSASLLSAEKKLLLFSGWTADRYPVLSM
jgi:hypothetical protein